MFYIDMRGGFTLIKFGKVALNLINFNFAGDLSGAKSNVAALDMGGGSTQITFVPSQMVIIDKDLNVFFDLWWFFSNFC